MLFYINEPSPANINIILKRKEDKLLKVRLLFKTFLLNIQTLYKFQQVRNKSTYRHCTFNLRGKGHIVHFILTCFSYIMTLFSLFHKCFKYFRHISKSWSWEWSTTFLVRNGNISQPSSSNSIFPPDTTIVLLNFILKQKFKNSKIIIEQC